MDLGEQPVTAILIFACSFGVVLALGLQQLNVSGGHYLAAFVTSLAIAGCNLALLKLVPQPTGALEVAGYLFGSPLGILVAMYLHPRLVQRLRKPANHQE